MQILNSDRYHFSTYEEKLLSNEEDREISARRNARKEEARRRADVRVPLPAEIIQGNVHERVSLGKPKAPRKKYNLKKLILAVGVLAIAAAFVINAGLKLTNLQLQKRDAEKQLQSLKEKADSLTAELQEIDTDEYVENAARVELHMINDGEVMYIVNPQLNEEAEELEETVKTK